MIIYSITNTVNGKKYVGQHCGMSDSRWKQHLKDALVLENPKPLYRAMRKYGAENFKYEVIEVLPNDSSEKFLDEREIYWIKEHKSHISQGQGYNLTFGGDGTVGAYCSSKTREKLSNSLDRTNYAKYDPTTGDLVQVYEKLRDAAQENGVRNAGTIPTAAKFNNQNTGKYKSVAGYIWLSGPQKHEFATSITPGNRKLKKRNVSPRVRTDTEIGQFALSGLLIKVWEDSLRDIAAQMSLPYKSILDAVNGRRKIAGGYFWKRFPKDQTPDEIEEKMEKHVITFSKRQLTTYPILMLKKDKEIKKYQSVMDAIIDQNALPTDILNSLELGKDDSKGYNWKWIERPNYIRHTLSEMERKYLSN